MKVVACYKVIPDNEDIVISQNQTLDFSRAEKVLGEYDLCALEEAVRIAQETEGSAALLTFGDTDIDNSKLIKAALSRGANELYLVTDEVAASFDAYQTACTLAAALRKIEFDLVICGEGSSDLYAQQVGSLLGGILKVETYNAIGSIKAGDGFVTVERILENQIDTLEVPLPALLSVTTNINLPRIPGMKDILAAGKKPVTKWSLTDLNLFLEPGISIVRTLAPVGTERKQIILENDSEVSVDELAAIIRKEQ